MSCDNLEGNGRLTKRMLTAFARLADPELAEWVEREVHFPNSMVDRITPVTTDADRAEVREVLGIDDRWPVVCEPYTQWVLEDAFTAGRPPYERAGVQLVEQVEPYELMKLRLLNGSHQAMCYFAYLQGYRLVHEAAQDPLYQAFLLGYMDKEAAPTLPPVPGVDLDAYKRTLIERFSNPHIRDTIARVCAQSSDRIPKWVLPVVRHQLGSGGEIRRSAGVVASWARYAEGVDEQGDPIEVADRLADSLTQLARSQRESPDAFIAHRDLFAGLAAPARGTSDGGLAGLTMTRWVGLPWAQAAAPREYGGDMTTLGNRPNTALLVIDVQNGVVEGAHERDTVVANVGSLVEKARREGVPVVWVQHSDEQLAKGSDEWRIVPELSPAGTEPLVEKNYGDSFEDTTLETVLAGLGVGRLVVAGAQTDACIRSTLHGAFARGYDATLVSDAHTTEDQTAWGAPPPGQVIAHTNLYWTYQTAPGRTAGTAETKDVDFGTASKPA
jgi:hypothetical protein